MSWTGLCTCSPWARARAPRYFGTLRNRVNANGDISLSKFIDITERFRAQLRAEFFNITSTPPFGLPTGGGQVALGSGAFGTVNRSYRPPRQIQMALKLMLGTSIRGAVFCAATADFATLH